MSHSLPPLRLECECLATTGNQAAADKLPAIKNRLDSSEQVGCSLCLRNVAPCSQAKGCLHQLWGRFLRHEDYLGFRCEFANLSSGFDSIQRWESDIEENQVRLQFFSFLNCFLPIGHFADDLQVWPFRQCLTNKLAERREILYHDKAD